MARSPLRPVAPRPVALRLGAAALALLAAAALLAGSGPPAPPAGAAPAAAAAGADPAELAPVAVPPLPAAEVAAAARALRRRDCRAAVAALDAPAAGDGPEAAFATLVQGLYAHACEDVALAEAKLLAAERPGGVPLDDWRLLVLADSAVARDHPGVAQSALARLLAAYPASPLAERALTRAADLARRQGDAAGALALVERGRELGIGGPAAAQLEAVAWEIGAALGDPEVRRAAARRLLVEAPLDAKRLGVADAYRAADGAIDWPALLSPDDLLRRAASFLALDMAPAALATLDEVPPAARGVAWRLLEARALTADRRGLAALGLLADAAPATEREAVEIEWARAAAALDAATAYRGRTNLPSAERHKLRRAAQQHLAAAAGPGADDALCRRALSRLFVELSEENRFDDVVEVLRRLRQIDPEDATGARYLWELGWGQYAARNYTGAVGYWTELGALYPGDRFARSGRYWTARAFAALGDAGRARGIYAEIAAADTTDFYRRHALARLGDGPPAAAAPAAGAAGGVPGEPWPDDPALRRARLLTDLGLDDLAVAELEAVGAAAEPRAAAALTALVEARRGERLASIAHIRRAFPTLGGPIQARLPAEALRIYYPLDYDEVIRAHADQARLPLHLVYAMIRQESAFDPRARSRAGARGLMQVMPATGRELARRLGLAWSTAKLDEPQFNLRLGTVYFRQVLEMFDDNLDLALAGYNGGPYRIKRLWTEAGAGRELDAFLEGLSVEESKIYVKRILVLSDSYRQLYPDGRRPAGAEL
jgi:soluble lytic murein transglycosylase